MVEVIEVFSDEEASVERNGNLVQFNVHTDVVKQEEKVIQSLVNDNASTLLPISPCTNVNNVNEKAV